MKKEVRVANYKGWEILFSGWSKSSPRVTPNKLIGKFRASKGLNPSLTVSMIGEKSYKNGLETIQDLIDKRENDS